MADVSQAVKYKTQEAYEVYFRKIINRRAFLGPSINLSECPCREAPLQVHRKEPGSSALT
jgi:hypothetical protein